MNPTIFANVADRLVPVFSDYRKRRIIGVRISIVIALILFPLPIVGLVLLPYAAFVGLKCAVADSLSRAESFSQLKWSLIRLSFGMSALLLTFYALIGFLQAAGNTDGLLYGIGAGALLVFAADIGFASAFIPVTLLVKREGKKAEQGARANAGTCHESC